MSEPRWPPCPTCGVCHFSWLPCSWADPARYSSPLVKAPEPRYEGLPDDHCHNTDWETAEQRRLLNFLWED